MLHSHSEGKIEWASEVGEEREMGGQGCEMGVRAEIRYRESRVGGGR